jgi:SWI/SNF-related matrix-associated actin-dependent regulator 1 of chromatin subfamily A
MGADIIGSQKEREELREKIEINLKDINVIVTTYQLASGNKIDTHFLRQLSPRVCVYDEGHMLKNSNSNRYIALMKIKAEFRLLLTGTPLQNNLLELASLLSFILPNVFNNRKEDLNLIFKHRAKTTDENHDALLSAQRIARAKSMMTPFVLRRRKNQVLKDIPPKTSRVVYCDMMIDQYEIYQEEIEKGQQILRDRAAGLKPTKASANIMMQLRKAAIHSLLFRKLYTDKAIAKMAAACMPDQHEGSTEENVLLDMQVMTDGELNRLCTVHYPKTLSRFALPEDACMNSGKVAKLIELLQEFKANGDRTLIFSQFTMVMDILESALSLQGISYFRLDGSTPVEERQDMIDQFYEETDISAFMLSTKAGGTGINLACANKVVIFDSSFNPQEDVQAENRAHRVGQTREVEVIRLVTQGTIEVAMMALGTSKLTLDDRVSGEAEDEKAIVAKGEELVAQMLADGKIMPMPSKLKAELKSDVPPPKEVKKGIILDVPVGKDVESSGDIAMDIPAKKVVKLEDVTLRPKTEETKPESGSKFFSIFKGSKPKPKE